MKQESRELCNRIFANDAQFLINKEHIEREKALLQLSILQKQEKEFQRE